MTSQYLKSMPRERKSKPPTEATLLKSAVHYLERYASSSSNLRRVLERRILKACMRLDRDPQDFAAMVDMVIRKCENAGLLDDKSYAETKAASLRRRGGSRRKIEAKLIANGIDRQTINETVGDDAEAERQAAIAFARRRRLGPYRNHTGIQSDMDRQRTKDLAAMCRAGFPYEIACRVIDMRRDNDFQDAAYQHNVHDE